jgi:hypothetical protein
MTGGPPAPSGVSLQEISTQVSSVETQVTAVQAAVDQQSIGVKQVIRGHVTNEGTYSFSPTVTPSKCVLMMRGIYENGGGFGYISDAAIVTSLTSNSISIDFAPGIDEAEYQNIEHY